MGIKITDGLLPPVTEDDTIYLHEKCTSSEYTDRPGVGAPGRLYYLSVIFFLLALYLLNTLLRSGEAMICQHRQNVLIPHLHYLRVYLIIARPRRNPKNLLRLQ